MNNPNHILIPDFPQTKEEWEDRLLKKLGPEKWFGEEKERFDRDWPRFKTLL